jgi:16S rRNA C967 or C1407 C5-methylase (RsmB/RsmF family)/NOL1/NOP2/fmu family ribosome biogenesis protein
MPFPDGYRAFVKNLSEDLLDRFESALSNPGITSIRKHPRHSSPIGDTPVAWSRWGFYLGERPFFTGDPFFQAGHYYVQEASSMSLEQVWHQLELPEHPRVLDLCAAPGGKSTHLLSLMDGKGLLVSNEIDRGRSKALVENLSKWGYSNQLITNSNHSDFWEWKGLFDLVLIDAPCSGEGMFRKDNPALEMWSPDLVQKCALRQEEIIEEARSLVAENGYLIYSTCTLNEDENEFITSALIDSFESIEISTDNFENPQVSDGGVRFIPGLSKGEGLFISCFQKRTEERPKKLKGNRPVSRPSEELKNYLEGDFVFLENGDEIHFISKEAVELLPPPSKVKELQVGRTLGSFRKKNFLPHQDLAHSVDLKDDAFPRLELDQEQALSFLRGESLRSEGNGIHLVTHKKARLGWVKCTSGRANNLFPKERRVKTIRAQRP